MRILLTGATGFVGQALVPALEALGHDLTLAVRPGSGPRAGWSGIRQVLIRNLGPETDFSPGLEGADVVVHLAGMAHIRTQNPWDLYQGFMVANYGATLKLGLQAARAGVRRFIFLSSIGVNGLATRPGARFRETDAPAPHNAYGLSKLKAEQGLAALERETGMETVILRAPLVCGPRAKANFLRLMGLVHSGLPLPFAGVNNRRSLLGLTNLIDILVICLDHPKAGGQTFLISDGRDLSTKDLVCRMARAMGKRSHLFPVPAPLARTLLTRSGQGRIYDQLWGDLSMDISKIQGMLGWQARVSLDEELGRAARWYLDSAKLKSAV